MEINEFKRILENGMGRAILHLKNHDPKPYRQAILDVCLNNPILDRQVEGDGTDYLWEVLKLSDDPNFYYQAIFKRFKALDDATPPNDIRHVYCLMGYLGFKNVPKAEKLVKKRFLANPAFAGYEGAYAVVIASNELDGLFLVAETLGAEAYEDADWETGRRLFTIWDDEDEAMLWEELEKRAQTSPNTRAYIDAVRQKQGETNYRDRSKRDKLTDYASVKTYIEGLETSTHYMSLRLWGKRATEDNLKQAALDLIAEKDPLRLQAYLKIFELTPFPLDTSPIRELLDGDSERLARAAIRALANTDGARELGLELIAQNKWRIYAGELFRNKIEEDDWKLLADLAALPLSRDDYHGFWISTRHLTDQLNPLAIPLLLNVYELIPCGFCREGIVSDLHKLDAVPDWMWEECRFDRNWDLRELAQGRL